MGDPLLSHWYDDAATPVESVTLPPLQKVVGPPAVTVGEGEAFCVTVTAADVPLQPLALVAVTV
jgi:hypothetical protein